MTEIICKKCKNKWDYKGNARRVSCSKCKTSITIDNHKIEKAVSDIVKLATPIIPEPEQATQTLTNHKVTEVKFPKTLWNDARLSQRFMALDNMGETYLVLKVDAEGMLSLS